MPPMNIAASSCTRQIGSEGTNQRGPLAPQISWARASPSGPATFSRSFAPMASWTRWVRVGSSIVCMSPGYVAGGELVGRDLEPAHPGVCARAILLRAVRRFPHREVLQDAHRGMIRCPGLGPDMLQAQDPEAVSEARLRGRMPQAAPPVRRGTDEGPELACARRIPVEIEENHEC